MKNYYTIVVACLFFNLTSQVQYVKNFTPVVKDFSNFGFGSQGYLTDYQSPRRCTFDDYYPFGQYGSYSTNIYDPQAQSLAPNWDSIVYKFNYKTTGFAKNFKIQIETPSSTNILYTRTTTYTQPDSQFVHLNLGLFFTYYSANFKIWLIKQDTTLNNFTVSLSDLDIKGYLHYSPTGINSVTKSENKIYSNNETIFFGETWIGKKYWITDIYGKTIYTGIVNSPMENISLENGLYILNTDYSSQKMIISSY